MAEQKTVRKKLPFMGAIVFLVVFAIFLVATLGFPDLPPGKQVYGLLNVAEIQQPMLGIPATLLIEAIFNGVIYGVIAWLIFIVAFRLMEKS